MAARSMPDGGTRLLGTVRRVGALTLLFAGLSPIAGGQEAPVCDAGPARVVLAPDDATRLLGSASDADGSIVQWQWTQRSGPPATLGDADQPTARLSGLGLGPAVFRLEVQDDQGQTAFDEVTVLATDGNVDATPEGSLETWHRIDLEFSGNLESETADPNPFLDARLDVVFARHGGVSLRVPGYYAADGEAAETGADAGGVWRVHFAPPSAGSWFWWVSFRRGAGVAAGAPGDGVAGEFDASRGSFVVRPSGAHGRDFRAHGTLRTEGRYLRHAGSRDVLIKGGAGSPENFLAAVDFDGSPNATHLYAPHLADYDALGGGPTWRGGLGKGILGAVDYLAWKGVNSLFFLTLSIEGDGEDVWPFISDTEFLRYDCSKLDQWERVFSHLQQRGIVLHVVTQETENDHLLDDGRLLSVRRVYYRELIARFGHHNALIWNLGEENTNSTAQVLSYDQFFEENDPYRHPLVLHTYDGKKDRDYGPMLDAGALDGASLQVFTVNYANEEVRKWVGLSEAAGVPWVVAVDECGPGWEGVVPDDVDPDHDMIRKRALWGSLLAGGGGCEWLFGSDYPHDDLDCEDFRSRNNMWEQTRHARRFMEDCGLPLGSMHGMEDLTGRYWDHCLARPGEHYIVLRHHSPGTTTLDLENHEVTFPVRWYDPRNGGILQAGSIATVTGPGVVDLGKPPGDTGDWVARVSNAPPPPRVRDFSIEETGLAGGLRLRATVSDLDGPGDLAKVAMLLWHQASGRAGEVRLHSRGGEIFGRELRVAKGLPAGEWHFAVQAVDRSGQRDRSAPQRWIVD